MTLFAAVLRASLFVAVSAAAIGAAGQPRLHAQVSGDSAAPTIGKGLAPDWIVERTLPPATPEHLAQARGGSAYLLTDWQVRGSDHGHTSYYRVAGRVVERSGLEEAGKIEISFDPRFETATLNFVRIVRDGKVIDRTSEVTFAIVEREDRLDEGIISGQLRAIANLKDVRVGDVVDYAVTHDVRTTLWPGHFFNTLSARYSVPVARRGIRILWPANRPLGFKLRNTAIGLSVRQEGGMQLLDYMDTDPDFEQAEDAVPSWHPQFGSIDFSTMTRWSEVVDWAVPHYAGDEALPADFARKLDAIGKRWPRAEDRLTEATRLVQDTIRYVGEELGEGSYVPRRPAMVVERGYGDCKDKALLLAVALRRLGIDAVPALVSTRPGYDLPERLPSPLAFDHVVVRATLGGKAQWIDATASYQGGRGAAMVPSSLGYALPIRAGQTALEDMGGAGDRAGLMAVVERFEIDESAPTAMTLKVETRYTGSLADWARARSASRPASEQGRENLKFYQKRFAGLAEAKPLTISDDREANLVIEREDYSLSRAAFGEAKLASDLVIQAYAVNDMLPRRQGGTRRYPLALPRDARREQTIEIRAKGRRLVAPDDVDMKAGGIAFKRTSTIADGTLRMVYRLDTSGTGSVPADAVEPVFALSDELVDESGLVFHLDRTGKGMADDAIDPAAIAPWRAQLEQAMTLMEKDGQPASVAALSIVNDVAAKVARPSPLAGLVDGMKGRLLAKLNRLPAAKTALLSSAEQYSGDAATIWMLMAVQLDTNDPQGFADALKRAAEHHPELVAELDPEWIQPLFWRQSQALPVDRRTKLRGDVCILLASQGWRQDPAAPVGRSMVDCAVQAQVERGHLAKARALIARKPSAETLLELAVDRRFEAIWPELEKLRGNGFRAEIERDVATAAAAAAAAPDDFELATSHVRALRGAGDPAAAIAAGRRLAGDGGRIEADGDKAFWFVNEYAYALADAGRADEAFAAMDGIVGLGLETYPGLVSQMINYAEMLVAAGRHERALTVLAKVEENGAQASTFGKMWIWATRACALRELGRGSEAEALDKRLADQAATNGGAVTMAAACRGDSAAIETQLIARLADPSTRTAALATFADYTRRNPETPFTAKMRATMQAARARPAVKAKADSLGRSVKFAGSETYWGSF